MNDIVERLRQAPLRIPIELEAADEIERLRIELSRLENDVMRLEAENEGLRAELHQAEKEAALDSIGWYG